MDLFSFNPIGTGFFYLVVALDKISSRHPRALKLGGLIAYIMLYKIS